MIWNLWCDSWLALLLWAAQVRRPIRRALPWGYVMSFTVTTYIKMRVIPWEPLPGGRMLIRTIWNPPALMTGYLIDCFLGPLLFSNPRPFFDDGNGNFITDINDRLCMGGRPLAKDIPDLVNHGVHSVVNMAAEWPGPTTGYSRAGIVQLRLATLDTTPPLLEDIRTAVAFVQRRLKENGDKGRVYIHCKGGRGRATSVVISSLMALDGVSAKEAFKDVKTKRPVCE